MASLRMLGGIFTRINQRNTLSTLKQFARSKTTTETGAIVGEPQKVSLGLLKVITVTTPFLIIGASISERGAALLEELDIFVPEDDDD